ncbi:hypothetical protein DOTSEDRAFT_71314 [Dothistroma septosporum NZE10]|uniref:Uncharacterized protein n=1 Tax=Dothistroma septosporum (strain NZE10 / CBS 128990) TaxID=675120 RepID=N1PRK8_DOTSN|nr:hypothetical protein DOTSEDRAFT_71314 [Dothistroma septosporum NZE10]
MPKKKHTFNFKQLQGSSSGGSQAAGQDGSHKAVTVNERLAESRKVVGKNAEQKKRELAEAVSQRSALPPQIGAIIGVPDSAPPLPKRGTRTRLPNRTPGPAPPASWTKRTAWSPLLPFRCDRRSQARANNDRGRPSELMRFGQLVGPGMGGNDGRTRSLVHLALKTAAESWDMFDEEDLPALAELPLRLRLKLMSYLGYYGPDVGISVFVALTIGNEPVTFLDLAGFFGTGSLTLNRLVKYLKADTAAPIKTEVEPTVVDSWDQDEIFETALTPELTMSRFAQLTHLSLSHPSPGASWRDLLAMLKQTPSLTHLSLAYWPRPTLTPNLATTTVNSQHSPPVRAGGSHYYSGLDEDYSEPASILRQMSSNLLRLQWLDLEGCTEWVPAMAYHGSYDDDFSQSRSDYYGDLPIVAYSAITSIFAHNWKGLKVIRCGQGWLPKAAGLRALPRQTMCKIHQELVDGYLESLDPLGLWWIDNQAADVYDVEKRRADIWVQRESRAHVAAKTINSVRRDKACSFISFDFGWAQKT